MSRKQFFVLAISEYFEWRAEAKITRQLNRIYSQEKSKLDPGLQRAQLESLRDANQIARR
jgi:hypothetical protein